VGVGFGVEDRELPHGVTDSTAALKYDFSTFSDLLSGMESIFSARRSNRPATFCLTGQAEVEVRTLSGKYLGTVLTCCATSLMMLANLSEAGGGRRWKRLSFLSCHILN
jgi:hypothetical protein